MNGPPWPPPLGPSTRSRSPTRSADWSGEHQICSRSPLRPRQEGLLDLPVLAQIGIWPVLISQRAISAKLPPTARRWFHRSHLSNSTPFLAPSNNHFL